MVNCVEEKFLKKMEIFMKLLVKQFTQQAIKLECFIIDVSADHLWVKQGHFCKQGHEHINQKVSKFIITFD